MDAPRQLLGLPVEVLDNIGRFLCWDRINQGDGSRGRFWRPGVSGLPPPLEEWEGADAAKQQATADLLALAQTCRRLHSVARPLLVRCFFRNDRDSADLFLRTLAEQPGLARQVVELDVAGVYPKPRARERFLPSFVQHDGHVVLQELRVASNQAVLSALQVQTLLEATAPNLQSLAILVPAIFRNAPPPPRLALPRLRRLTMLSDEGDSDVDWMAGCLGAAAQSLEVLHLHQYHTVPEQLAQRVWECREAREGAPCRPADQDAGAGDGQQGDDYDDGSFQAHDSVPEAWPAFRPRDAPLPGLVELNMTDHGLGLDDLCGLLMLAGPKLARVRYEPRSNCSRKISSDEDSRGVHPVDAAIALRQKWTGTMRSLSLAVYRGGHLSRGPELRPEILAFPRLEELRLDWASVPDCMIPWSSVRQDLRDRFRSTAVAARSLGGLLPPALCRLSLQGRAKPYLTNNLQMLANAVQVSRLARLESIEVDNQIFLQAEAVPANEYQASGMPAPLPELHRLRQWFQDAGVHFIVREVVTPFSKEIDVQDSVQEPVQEPEPGPVESVRPVQDPAEDPVTNRVENGRLRISLFDRMIRWFSFW